MKKQNVLIIVYLIIWSISLLVFWLFMSGSDAMAYGLIFLYALIPFATLVISFLIGKNNYWGKGKWLAPIVFGIMHMLAEYLTFSLKNMVSISFHRINAPNLELLFAGIVLYEISVGAGHFIYRKKLKHK